MLIIALLLTFTFKTSLNLTIKKSCQSEEWEEHKYKYNLEYSVNEDGYRKGIFMENCQFIIQSNLKNPNLTLKMNQFGHLKKSERPMLLSLNKPLKLYEDEEPVYIGEELPSSYDWRWEGVVTPVQNQLTCGSCYAFSTVGAIESSFAIHTGILRELSAQEIVDCSEVEGNYACNGGFPESAYQYVFKNGLSTYNDYPYTARYDSCRRNNQNSSNRLIGYRGLKKGDEENLIRGLYHIGPISIAMDASHNEFYFYQSGIIDFPYCSSYNLNHAVLAVGYNLTETPYLLVKNSYGTDWGIEGYFKIALNRNNMCGISSWATFPIIERDSIA